MASYEILNYPESYFDFFIEIGAENGSISKAVCQRSPKTQVIAYEPCKTNYERTCRKLRNSDAIIVNKALGNGKPLFFQEQDGSTRHRFVETSPPDSYAVESIRLSEIMAAHNIDMRTALVELAIDCEGGEWSMVGDKEAEDTLRQCVHVGMEAHFLPKDLNKSPQFASLPEWDVFNQWVHDSFTATHSIKYWCSSKRIGIGTYVLHRK